MIYSHPSLKILCPTLINGEGSVYIGENVSLGYPGSGNGNIIIQARSPESRIGIGDGTCIANGAEIFSLVWVEIGKNCNIGRCVIMDTDFHGKRPDKRIGFASIAAVYIGNNVLICEGAIILKGVRIGDNSIIGAGCVVCKDVPVDTVWAGKNLGSVWK